jgi:hypothetical protein
MPQEAFRKEIGDDRNRNRRECGVQEDVQLALRQREGRGHSAGRTDSTALGSFDTERTLLLMDAKMVAC